MKEDREHTDAHVDIQEVSWVKIKDEGVVMEEDMKIFLWNHYHYQEGDHVQNRAGWSDDDF